MVNTILTPTQVTREALRILHQKCKFIGSINRQYDDSFAKSGAKIGDSLKIRLPNQYTVRSNATLSTQTTTEASTTLQVATQKGVDVEFTSAELTLSLDDFSKRILDPAMSVLATAIEADALSMALQVWNHVGTAGTTPNAILTYLQARQKMVEGLTPDGTWNMLVSPLAGITIVDALKGLFQSSRELGDQYKEGIMGTAAGYDWMESTVTGATFTNPADITVAVSGASQTGSSLTISGVTNPTTFKAGMVFTVPGVYTVHPETKVAYGSATANLQQFTVTADTTISATSGSIPIAPEIVVSGARQTVSASPTDTDALTFIGSASTTYKSNLAYHKDAFTIAFADLVMPKGVHFAAREVYDGISMRIVQAYDITNDTLPCRIDVLYGYKAIRPQFACRIATAG